MNITEYMYFNFFTIGALIPTIFMGLLAYFFSVLKNKSPAAVNFSRFLALSTIFFLSYVVAAAIYHPAAAFHRWGTVVTVVPGMVVMSLAVFNFPDIRYPRFGKIYLAVWFVIYAVTSVYFYYDSLYSAKVFQFSGHYWDFAADASSAIYAMFIVFSILCILIMGVFRAVVNKGTERWAALAMGVSVSLAFMIPGVLNLLSRDGLIDRGTYQISQNLSTITGVFIGTIVYLNTTKDRSTFMSKILIVTLATLLLLVQGFSYFSLQDQEISFDQLLQQETTLSIVSGSYSADIDYMVYYAKEDDRISTEYAKDDVWPDIDFSGVKQEFHNTLVYERIKQLDSAGFHAELEALLNDTDKWFAGYRQGLLEYAAALSPDADNPGGEILAYVDSLERLVLYTRNKILELPPENFAEHILEFLPGARTQIFNDVITEHVINSTAGGEELKNEVLTFMTPVRGAGSRIYRRDEADSNHFVAVMEADPEAGTVIEAGYPYLLYRAYVHETSQKYIVMLLVMVAVVFIGFPFFFWGSLVVPIKSLLAGLREMQEGNLKVQIPIRVEDEFGYMSRNFNDMASKIRAATENLEEKVADRTRDLQAAMEELEDKNRQVLEARDALWGEMELAKKIQMKLLPEDPAMPDYEIAAYMEPADEVGGDYYDIINVGGYDWVVIGDVSGHGVPAGLIMMMTQTAIHIALEQNPGIAPDKLLNIVNSTISQNIRRLGEEKYMTITVLAASQDGRFTFSGLHQDILIYREKTGELDIVETQGMWIGIVDDLEGMLEVDTLQLNPGDVMFLYSDGITEAKSKDEESEDPEYGEDRLCDMFKNNAHKSMNEIRDILLADLEDYTRPDDVTMVVLKRVV